VKFFSRDDRDSDLNAELQSHLRMDEQTRVDRGASPEQASLDSRREFGNSTLVRETTRDMWGWARLERLTQDIRYALRLFAKTPVITAVALLSLALGIGANTAIFSLLDAVMLRALPVQKPEELVRVLRSAPWYREPIASLTNPIWEQLRDHQDVFSGIAASSEHQMDLSEGGAVHFANGLYVSGEYFTTLGVRPAAGRLFTASDDQRGCSGTAVLSYPFWQRQFGAAPDAVGKMIRLDSHEFEVIGVAQPGFFGTAVGHQFDVAIPICSEAIMRGSDSMLDERSAWWLAVIGRLEPGGTADQARARLQVLAPRIYAAVVPADYPEAGQKRFLQLTFAVAPAANGVPQLSRQYSRPLLILMAVVALVLLIACANIASLMLARASSRRKEIAVRLAVGASRLRLIRQLLTECLILSLAGAALGILFARLGSNIIVRLISTTRDPIFLDLSPRRGTLAFTAGVAVLTGIIFGILPAMRSTRLSLSGSMRVAAGSSGSRSTFRGGRWIVAFQVALSLALLVGTSLFVRSFRNVAHQDLGFDRENVYLARLFLERSHVPREQWFDAEDVIAQRLRALPGVESAAMAWTAPLGQIEWNNYIYAEGGKSFTGEDATAYFNQVTPGYFEALRTPVLAGRDFNSGDTGASQKVSIANLALARHFFNDDAPLGRYFRIDAGKQGKSAPIQIVGVVKDAAYIDLREKFPPTAFFPSGQMGQAFNRPTLVVRANLSGDSLSHAIESVVASAIPGASLTFQTLSRQVDENMTEERLLATLSGFFGALALLLAMIGLYGVLAYVVTLRQREIGIRMALGAKASRIVGVVLQDVAALLAVGIPVGLAIAALSGKLVEKLLFNIHARDFGTMLLSSAALVAVALIAAFFPARRAARVDPMVVLREE
jgi:predicted permease